MATLDPKEDQRHGFLRNSNRKVKVIDGDQLLRVALSSSPSDETRSPPRNFGIPCNTDCVADSPQATSPALGASSSSRDLMDSPRHIPVPNQQQHQNRKTKMNDASAREVKKGGFNTTPVSRLSKQKKEIGEPPKHTTRATSRTPESKQLKPLKDPDGSVIRSTISRIRASLNFVQKKEKAEPPKNSTDLVQKNENPQPLRNPTALVEYGGTSTILASKQGLQKKKTAKASKDPVEAIKNNGTSRMVASKHVKDKRETAQPPKDPAALVRNTGTSKIPASGRSIQKKETTQSPKDSAKSNATTSKIPVQKQSDKQKNSQPSKGTSGLVSRTGTVRALRSNLVSREEESITAKPIRQNQITDHRIMWKGFDEGIVPFGKSCPLCEGDLAEDPEHPDAEHLYHVENAVLSCGHVFHGLCLRLATTEENSRDPQCIICFSLL